MPKLKIFQLSREELFDLSMPFEFVLPDFKKVKKGYHRSFLEEYD
jgi:hypothetical protein